MIFGAILCCIPGIIVGVFFYVTGGIVVWEGMYGIPALKRSYHLTKPYFWRVLWIVVLFMLIFIIFYVLLTEIPSLFIPTVPSFFKHIFTSQAKGMITPWWYILYQHFMGAVIAPINAIMTYILYRNLKEANELNIELPLNLTTPTPDNESVQ